MSVMESRSSMAKIKQIRQDHSHTHIHTQYTRDKMLKGAPVGRGV